MNSRIQKRLIVSAALTVSMDAMAARLAHMRANRLLRSAHRAQEAVLYEFLERIYEGRAARRKADLSRVTSAPAPRPARPLAVEVDVVAVQHPGQA